MTAYAYKTKVPVSQSRNEIERVLARYGALEFVSGWDQGRSLIAFRCHDRFVRFELPMPKRADFTSTTAYEQEERRLWRALVLCIKSKLEAVQSGIATFEEEFLAHIVMPNGETIGRWVVPQLQQFDERREMPKLLPGAKTA